MERKKMMKENTKEGQDQNSADQTTAATGSPAYNEPIELLLEPFGKERLTILLTEAAKKHPDVADRIREMSYEDPIHRNVYVNGLRGDTQDETLIDAFKQYGEIEDCTAILDRISGKCRGYGFILFKSRSGALNALKEPGKMIGDRMASCKLASENTPATPQGSSILGNCSRKQRTILVSNVREEVDPQSLYDFFSKYGEIEEGPLGLDRATGKPRGFCVFVYKTIEGVRRALEEPHKNFEGHCLRCKMVLTGSRHNKQHKQNTPENLVAPTQPSMGGESATQALNPALGQSLTPLPPAQGDEPNLNPANDQPLFGTSGPDEAVYPSFASGGMPDWYGTQVVNTHGVMPGYGIQSWYQIPYPNQHIGQHSAESGQHFVGQHPPYMGQ